MSPCAHRTLVTDSVPQELSGDACALGSSGRTVSGFPQTRLSVTNVTGNSFTQAGKEPRHNSFKQLHQSAVPEPATQTTSGKQRLRNLEIIIRRKKIKWAQSPFHKTVFHLAFGPKRNTSSSITCATSPKQLPLIILQSQLHSSLARCSVLQEQVFLRPDFLLLSASESAGNPTSYPAVLWVFLLLAGAQINQKIMTWRGRRTFTQLY